MRQCIKEMTDKGIPAFVDKRGREWSPEAYVNMAIRTTAANTAQQAQFDRMDDYGLNLVEVSSHSGARPKCAKDQGKIFNRSGGGGYTTDLHGRKIRYYAWSESSYGEPDGILGINCGHQIYPFTPGVSYQTYFPEPEEENAEAYKKSQQQRELERRVRKSKRECMMLETAGDPEGARQAQQLLKQRQDALRQFCGDNGLRYKPDRTAVADYKKSVAGYVPPDQTERIRKLNGLDVDKSSGSGIIEEKTVFEPLPADTVVPTLREDSKELVNKLSSEEIRAIKKYTKNSGDPKDDKFYARLNSMLRGDIPEDDTLKYYSDVISGAIAKFELKHDIISYRSVKHNPVEGMKIGDIYEPKQFISTAVISSRTIKGNYNIAIMIRKRCKGAYIELLSSYPNQREFLLDKNLKYRVLEIRGNSVVLEVVT